MSFHSFLNQLTRNSNRNNAPKLPLNRIHTSEAQHITCVLNNCQTFHFAPLTATLGGGGKYMPVDAAAASLSLGPAAPVAVSSSAFLSA